LLKIVTLQELQNIFFEWAVEGDPIKTKGEMFKASGKFLKNFKGKFFENEWKLKSLQSKPGREALRTALKNARRNSEYNGKDLLFQGIEK
jgi:hypothetical protein